MRKDILTFMVGLITGAILGILVRDKDKKMVQEAVANQMKHLRKRYQDLTKEGGELVREGLDKANELRKEYLG